MTSRLILERLISTIVTLFGAAVIVFVMVRLAPGNPIAMMLPPGATDADIARLKVLYGLDKSIPEQFVIWLAHALQGDFGASISLRQDVMGIILSRLPATLELSLLALVFAVAIGGTLAIVATRFRGRAPEAGIDLINGMSLSIPDFLWGLTFILLLGVAFPIFAISGRISPDLHVPFTTQFLLFESLVRLRFDIFADLMNHMLMPALALALPLAAVIAQLLKTSLKETMRQDYIMLAYTKGFSEYQVLFREALRNAALPTLTLIGVQFTFLIGGTVIVERIFSYQGLGNLAIDAVINRDLPLIQGIILIFAVLFIAINLIVDMAYAWLNPRLRHA
jgi:ABC-type dipeptide/oligopeptide/nickel transport system permease component